MRFCPPLRNRVKRCADAKNCVDDTSGLGFHRVLIDGLDWRGHLDRRWNVYDLRTKLSDQNSMKTCGRAPVTDFFMQIGQYLPPEHNPVTQRILINFLLEWRNFPPVQRTCSVQFSLVFLAVFELTIMIVKNGYRFFVSNMTSRSGQIRGLGDK